MQTDPYDVTLIGFPGSTPTGEPPTRALQRIFPIDEATASRFVRSAPVTVKHGATAQVARRYRQSLESIGAEVSVHLTTPLPRPTSTRRTPAPAPPSLDGVGVVTRPSSPAPPLAPPRPPRRRPSNPTTRPSGKTRPSAVVDSGAGFFASIPRALFLPLRGDGKGWLLAALGLGALSAIASFFPVAGSFLQLLLTAGLVTLWARYFQACMAATSSDEDSPRGIPDFSDFWSTFALPGLAMTLWLVVSYLPLVLWIGYRVGGLEGAPGFDPMALVLLALPLVLWPMALSHEATTGRSRDLWNFPRIVLGVVRSPLRYTVVLVAGALTTLIPFIALSTIFAFGSMVAAFAGLALIPVVMAYGHAVMGSLMGRLVRDEPTVLPLDR